ncbi:MAG: sigma-70 family RNA polymerase sigma factor [Candidatus Colwellbacteria bacterium]|nr:sigma-70 family RNA polymerase sigma factor [Candidatus Colwellbacteria bacterium]
MLEDEQKTIKKAQDGEVEAFGLLYEHYLPKIYRFVLIKVSQREEAEDLTHQAFLKAWENIEQYNPKGYSFGSWLYRIARNTVIDHYRGERPQVSLDDVSIDIKAGGAPLTEEINAKIELERLIELMGKLKSLEQEVLVMRFVDDLSPKEVAKAIDKSEGAVKLIQHRALKSLKEILENE